MPVSLGGTATTAKAHRCKRTASGRYPVGSDPAIQTDNAGYRPPPFECFGQQACARSHRSDYQSRGDCARLISECGGVAQLGERRVRNAKVGSSILLLSTTQARKPRSQSREFFAICFSAARHARDATGRLGPVSDRCSCRTVERLTCMQRTSRIAPAERRHFKQTSTQFMVVQQRKSRERSQRLSRRSAVASLRLSAMKRYACSDRLG